MEQITNALARAFNVASPNEEASDCANSRGPTDKFLQLDSDIDRGNVKWLATYAAKLALLGYVLHELNDRSFLVCRWDRSRHLDNLDAVAAFLRQVGGRHA